MKVKELIEALQQCDSDFEVFCGYEQDNMFDSNIIVEVVEARTLSKRRDKEGFADGVYIRMG